MCNNNTSNNIYYNNTYYTKMNNDDSTNTPELNIFLFLFNIISVLLDIVLIFKLKKTSKISRVLIMCIYAEAIQQFCQAVIFIYAIKPIFLSNFFNIIADYNMFLHIPLNSKFFSKNKQINSNIKIYKMYSINIALLFSSEAFSLLMHIFIYFELIFMLQNPIGSASLRVKIYSITSYLVSTSIIVGILYLYDYFLEAYTYKKIFEALYPFVFVNFILFVFMVILGILNILYTIRRLGCKNFLTQTYYNKFLLGQIIMMFTYYLCLTPLKIISFMFSYYNNITIHPMFVKLSLVLYSALGIVQFLSRVLETNFYSLIRRIILKIFCFCKKKTRLSRNLSKNEVRLKL